jgi:hypothetical protein
MLDPAQRHYAARVDPGEPSSSVAPSSTSGSYQTTGLRYYVLGEDTETGRPSRSLYAGARLWHCCTTQCPPLVS